MNYRHIFHAGNFSEVVKHYALTMIIDYLRKKSAPFCYIDTHAGEGIYDLTSVEAEKTGEAADGVLRILEVKHHPECMNHYLQGLQPYLTAGKLHDYPGSPLWAYRMLRPQDSMILNEAHPEINRILKQNFSGKPQVAIHQRDAYEFLPAILPPAAARGLVLIDPPFEKIDENENIQIMIQKSLSRWGNGIYMIWYPITPQRDWNPRAVVSNCAIKNYLIAELTITEEPEAKGLLGCRLLIINPPWKLAENLKILLSHLWKIFSIDHQGGFAIHLV